MKKAILSGICTALCFNFAIPVFAAATAVETAVPRTEISVAEPIEPMEIFEYDSSYEEGGFVPTHIDESITPSFTVAEEYTGALPEETAVSEGVVINNDIFGADEIVPAVREDGTPVAKYMTMGDLYQAWFASGEYEYNYPDYVCGVWTETGDMTELVVAVTKDEAGEAGKQEILSLIENDDSVKFTYQSYSYKELRQVQEELSSFMGDESGIYGIGVYEMENKVHADIDISNPNAEDYIRKFLGQYGDKLVFEAGGGITLDCQSEGLIDSAGGGYDGAIYTPGIGIDAGGGILTTGTDDVAGDIVSPLVTQEELAAVTEIGATGKSDNFPLFVLCAGAVLVLAAVIAVTVSRTRLKQTTSGVITEGGKLTAGDTEAIVAKSTEIPSRDILVAVMEEIEK